MEPTSRHNIGISVVAFVVPCVGLGAGYAVGQSLLGLGEGTALLTALVGLAVGCLPAILMNRAMVRSKAPEFSILKFLR